MEQIEVLIADDQSLMRDGLKTILEVEPDIEVVATAENGKEAYELTQELAPDVILMDIRMPKMDGIESTKKIKGEDPEKVVLALTTFDDRDYIVDILSNGADGYLLKDIDGDKLVQSIKDALDGNLIMHSEVASKLAETIINNSNIEEEKEVELEGLDLSEREREVGKMLAQGFTNKQIASALYISNGTVKNYVSSIYDEIGISDRTKAALYLKQQLLTD